MGKSNKTLWSHSKTKAATLIIWIISAFSFFSLFHLVLNTSTHPHSHSHSSGDSPDVYREQRVRLYDRMASDLVNKGPAFLKRGETSNSLSISEIFMLKDSVVTPVHKPVNPPIRTTVLYLNTSYSVPISGAVRHVFHQYFEKAIWFQNSSTYHFSMFQASHHVIPVPATREEVEAEVVAVKGVVEGLCPIKIVLDRVVLTSTGVLLGCWQVISGTDPIDVRARLRAALPHAPKKQLYDDAIFHTSFARLLGPSSAAAMKDSGQLKFFQGLVARLNDQIRGFEAIVSELWYGEEYDLMAIALDGNITIRRFQFGCSGS